MSTILPDAAPTNWVDRHAPATLRPWLKLGRFDRPVGIWLLMLPGWMGIALACAMQGRAPDPLLLVLFGLGAALMRAAGCAYNDIVDRDIDAKVARTALRPIPAGQISVKQAWAFVVGCCLVSLLILLTMNRQGIVTFLFDEICQERSACAPRNDRCLLSVRRHRILFADLAAALLTSFHMDHELGGLNLHPLVVEMAKDRHLISTAVADAGLWRHRDDRNDAREP